MHALHTCTCTVCIDVCDVCAYVDVHVWYNILQASCEISEKLSALSTLVYIYMHTCVFSTGIAYCMYIHM